MPSREDSYKRLLSYIACWTLFGFGSFTICERDSGRIIGSCGVFRMERDVEPPLDGSPEAGWGISPDRHGRGFALESMTAALDWFDKSSAFRRSVCLIDVGNVPSEKLAAKLGYNSIGPGTYRGVEVHRYVRDI